MRTKVILVVLLPLFSAVVLLPLCSAAPLVKEVGAKDNVEHIQKPRQGKRIHYGNFKMGHISLSSDSVIEGDNVFIGHKLNINVHRHTTYDQGHEGANGHVHFHRHAAHHSNDVAGHHSNDVAGHHSNDVAGHHTNDVAGHHGHDVAGHHSNNVAGHHSNDVAGHHSNNVDGHHGHDGELKERLRLLFKSIDENQDGIIDVKELIVVCQENNIQITEAEAKTILTFPDKTAGVNMAVFIELLEHSPSSNTADMVQFLLLAAAGSLDHGEFEENLKYFFLALDTDHDCKIFIPDLQTVFRDMGSNIPLNEAKSLLSGEHHIHTIGEGLDFSVWKKLVLQEVFKTKHLIHYWREAFAEVKKSFYEVGNVSSTSILNVAKTSAATFLDKQLHECSQVKLVKVENAVVKIVQGLEFTLELRLATLVGENCKDSLVMVCENIAVLKPLPQNCLGIASLKLINRERITCTNICLVDQVNSDDCLCDSGTSGLVQSCSSNQGCSNYGICLDVCTADQTNSGPCFCKSRSSDSGVACSSNKGCAHDSSCPGGISQEDILNARINRIDQNLKTIGELTVAIQNIVDGMKVLPSARKKRSDDELSSDETKLLELVDRVTNLVEKCGNCHICESNKIKDMTQKIISTFNKMETETVRSVFQNSFDEKKAKLKTAISAAIKCLEEEKAKALTALAIAQATGTAAATTVVSSTTTTNAATTIISTASTIADTAAAAATMKAATTAATTLAVTTIKEPTMAATTIIAVTTMTAAKVARLLPFDNPGLHILMNDPSIIDSGTAKQLTNKQNVATTMIPSTTATPTMAVTATATTSNVAAITMEVTTTAKSTMAVTTTTSTTMAATNFYNWILNCINNLIY